MRPKRPGSNSTKQLRDSIRRPAKRRTQDVLAADPNRASGRAANLVQPALPAGGVAVIADEGEHVADRTIHVEVRHDIDHPHHPEFVATWHRP
jgi:hypothetical protein